MIKKLLTCESGTTAVEYGLIAAVLSLAMITGFGAFSDAMSNQFNYIATTVTGTGN